MTHLIDSVNRRLVSLPHWLRDWGNALVAGLALWLAGGLLLPLLVPVSRAHAPLLLAVLFGSVMGGGAVLGARVALRAGLNGRLRLAWGLFSLAMASQAVAFAIWYSAHGFLAVSALLAGSSVLFFSHHVLLLAGMAMLPFQPVAKPERSRFWLDAGTLLTASLVVSWHYVLEPVYRERGWDGLHSLVFYTYPIGDLLVLFVALMIWLRPDPEGLHRPLRWLTTSVVAFVAGDLGWATLSQTRSYWPGQWPDLLYLMGAVSMTLCAHRQYALANEAGGRWKRKPKGSLAARWLPYTAIGLVHLLLLAETNQHPELHLKSVVYGVVAVTILVAIRQMIIQRENLRLAAENAASRGEARFRSLVHHSAEAILIIGSDGAILYQSPSVQRVFGWSEGALSSSRLFYLIHQDERGAAIALLRSIAQEPGAVRTGVWRFRHSDSSWRHAEVSVQNLMHDPNVGGLVLNARDISDRKTLEEQLRHRATHDPLTGLANRALFRQQVEQALSGVSRAERQAVAVMFIDLDDFKTVNDSLGHGAGDELLVIAAQRLKGCCDGLVARLGGDEFAVLLTGADPEGAALRAERMLERLGQPIALGSRMMVTQGSIGIALGLPGEVKASDLMRNADMALYGAKRAGKNRHAVYDPAMHAAATERLELTGGLRRALERAEFRLHYQPIIALESGAVAGYEALVRWEHPQMGQIAPGRFIGLAEETGLIIPLGRWVLQEACRQAARWQASGAWPLAYVSVNLSPQQLHHAELVDEVNEALQEAGLAPESLVLEVTESSLLEPSEQLRENARLLKESGVRFALDDFGAGYASIGYLRWFPVDVIKLDRSLVAELGTAQERSGLVRGILNLTRAAGLVAVAEGVERPEQAEELKALGCQMAQGWLFGRPGPAPLYPSEVAVRR